MTFSAPDYAGRCLTALLPACAAAIGTQIEWAGGTAADAQAILGVKRSRRVCVVLIDGLGLHQLQDRIGHARFLAGRELGRLDSPFPSTTAVSLTALGTGRAAGVTGVAGYALRNPADGKVVSMIAWHGADPLRWQREPTIFERLTAQGVDAAAVLPGKFAGSGLTLAALRGARTLAADGPDQLLDSAVQALRAPGPGLVYVYWGELDRVGHAAGWRSLPWGEELARVDAFAARLAAAAPPHTAIYLTADHGMVDVAPGPVWDVASCPPLRDGVQAVGGEPRCLHLYTASGASGDVAARWRSQLGGAGDVLTRDEAEAAGWFGPVGPWARQVIGDVIVAMTGTATAVDSRVQSASFRSLAGQHGSLTPAERHVPFIRLA